MSHTTEIVKYEKLSNAQFSVVIRCCGHEDTDHPHTMAFLADPVQRAANLAEVHKFVAAQHEAALSTAVEFADKAGVPTEHSKPTP